MTTILDLTRTLQTLFTTTAERLARDTGFIQRQRQVTGAGFAQALVLGGLAHPLATRSQWHHHARQAGLGVSVQGFDQRFTARAVVFLRALLEHTLREVVQAEGTAPVILPAFAGVFLTDCTRLVWGATGIKLAVRWDIQGGRLQAEVMPLTQHDQRAVLVDAPLPRGALHLGDLGFFKVQRFHAWHEQGVYWLTRYKVGTRLFTPDGQPLDLKAVLQGEAPIRLNVRVGDGRYAVTAHLVAARLPDAALAVRAARLKEQARLDQRPLSQRQRELMGWTLYLTNIPDLSFAQAYTLARTRWQIEQLFKLWKSHGHLLISRSADPVRQVCEGYAKLMAVLIAHWTLLVAGWSPERLTSVEALRLLRTYVPQVQRAFIDVSMFADVCHGLRLDLDAMPRPSRRRKTPLAFQLWDAFDFSLA